MCICVVHRNSNNNGQTTPDHDDDDDKWLSNEQRGIDERSNCQVGHCWVWTSARLTLSVAKRHVRDLHVAVADVAADVPCYAAFSGSELPIDLIGNWHSQSVMLSSKFFFPRITTRALCRTTARV